MFVGGGGGSVNVFCVCVELGETGRVKNYLGDCILKITRPNGERSAILVSNPGFKVTQPRSTPRILPYWQGY